MGAAPLGVVVDEGGDVRGRDGARAVGRDRQQEARVGRVREPLRLRGEEAARGGDGRKWKWGGAVGWERGAVGSEKKGGKGWAGAETDQTRPGGQRQRDQDVSGDGAPRERGREGREGGWTGPGPGEVEAGARGGALTWTYSRLRKSRRCVSRSTTCPSAAAAAPAARQSGHAR